MLIGWKIRTFRRFSFNTTKASLRHLHLGQLSARLWKFGFKSVSGFRTVEFGLNWHNLLNKKSPNLPKLPPRYSLHSTPLSLSYTFIYARHIYKNSRKTTWELKRFLSSICAVVKYHFKIFFFCISFLLRPPSSSSTRHPVAVRILKSAVDLGQDRLTRVGRLQKTVSRAFSGCFAIRSFESFPRRTK